MKYTQRKDGEMQKLSMTAALATVNAAYGKPIRQSSTSYVVHVPYDISNDRSPSAEIRHDSYWKILCSLRISKAIDTLVLMGFQACDVDFATEKLAIDGLTVREIVKKLAEHK